MNMNRVYGEDYDNVYQNRPPISQHIEYPTDESGRSSIGTSTLDEIYTSSSIFTLQAEKIDYGETAKNAFYVFLFILLFFFSFNQLGLNKEQLLPNKLSLGFRSIRKRLSRAWSDQLNDEMNGDDDDEMGIEPDIATLFHESLNMVGEDNNTTIDISSSYWNKFLISWQDLKYALNLYYHTILVAIWTGKESAWVILQDAYDFLFRLVGSISGNYLGSPAAVDVVGSPSSLQRKGGKRSGIGSIVKSRGGCSKTKSMMTAAAVGVRRNVANIVGVPELEDVSSLDGEDCDRARKELSYHRSSNELSSSENMIRNDSGIDPDSLSPLLKKKTPEYNSNIPPAFSSQEEYPPGWLVYDPIRGVIPKELADKLKLVSPDASLE